MKSAISLGVVMTKQRVVVLGWRLLKENVHAFQAVHGATLTDFVIATATTLPR